MNSKSPFPRPDAVPCLYNDDLKAFFDGELSWWQTWRMRGHLRACPQCQEELKMIQTLTEELQISEPTAPLTPELRAQILNAARDTAPSTTLPSTTVATPAATPVPTWKPEPDSAPPRVRLLPLLAFFPIAACVALVFMTLTGGKIKNTFNAASTAITTSTDGGGIWEGFGNSSGAGTSSSTRAQNPPISADSMANPNSSLPLSGNIERSVHKQGSLSIAVKNVETSSDEVMRLVKNVGGFIASNSLSTQNGRSAQLETRVPVAKFEQIVSKIGQLGQVSAKNISGEDITDRTVATQARRNVLGQEVVRRQTQLSALQAKATRDNRLDRRDLQSQLAEARARFAEAEAQYQALHRLSALSALSVTLQEKAAPPAAASLSQDLGKTGREAWSSFLTTVRVPLFLLVYVLAYSPIWLPAILLWRRYAPAPRL